MNATISEAFKRFTPTSTLKNFWMIGPMMTSPMNPQMIEGIAASSSIRTLSVSFTLPVANSEM